MSSTHKLLDGQTVAITGGAGVIGHALAHGLAAAGASIAILDLDPAKAATLASELERQHGNRHIGLECNVLDRASIEKADHGIADAFGPLHHLINGAGGNSKAASTELEQLDPDNPAQGVSFFDIPEGPMRQTLDLNLLGTILPSQVLGRRLALQKSGSILNISSMNAYRPLTKIPAYSAGKSGVSNFTEWLATHLATAGVRVNAIAPGYFLTEQLKFLAFHQNGEMTERYRNVLKLTPMHRFGKPEELVGPALFLLSNMASFVTGVIIPVDGGFNAYSGI